MRQLSSACLDHRGFRSLQHMARARGSDIGRKPLRIITPASRAERENHRVSIADPELQPLAVMP